MNDIMTLHHQYISDTYKKIPLQIESGKGSVLYDLDGRSYIDLSSGIGVNCFGVADFRWKSAVNAQLQNMQHCSNIVYSEPCVLLAKLLCEKTGMKKVFFSNSGAEANECAVKAARKYSAQRKGADFYTIITLDNSFHGRTISMLAATGQELYHRLYNPLTPGFVSVPINDVLLKKTVNEVHPAAVMIECIQGEGGVIPLDYEFVKKVDKICKQKDIPLIVDEVQTGNGRTGKLYSYMHFDIKPDIVSTAKGLGGGLPIGATLFGEKLQDIFEPGDHGSTFGANPVCCAGALSVVERLDDDLMAQVQQKSKWIFDALQHSPGIEKVTGMGLMIGIHTSRSVESIITECLNQGVICLTAKRNIRLLPALNIPFELLKQGISILKNVCS